VSLLGVGNLAMDDPWTPLRVARENVAALLRHEYALGSDVDCEDSTVSEQDYRFGVNVTALRVAEQALGDVSPRRTVQLKEVRP
jgi:hypothetical protein